MQFSSDIADILTAIGLLFTLVGAFVAARAVILRREDAVAIGVSRTAYETDEENLQLPAVQNLLKSSRRAMVGLMLVVLGTALQLVPIACRLIQ